MNRVLTLTVLCMALSSPVGGRQLPETIPTELALAFMGGGMGEIETGMQIYVGRLPTDGLDEIYLPENTTVLGSMVRGAGTTIVLEMPGSAEAARTTYIDSLEAKGWTVPEAPPRASGFQTRRVMVRTMACRGENSYVNFAFSRVADDVTRVRLVFARMTAVNPCDGMRMTRAEVERRFPLPALFTPEDTRVVGIGGSGGGPSRGSNATLQTDRPLAEVVGEFEQQLLDEGWSSVSRDGGENFVFHAWTFRSDGRSFYGMLYAVTHPATPGRHFVSVRVTPAER